MQHNSFKNLETIRGKLDGYNELIEYCQTAASRKGLAPSEFAQRIIHHMRVMDSSPIATRENKSRNGRLFELTIVEALINSQMQICPTAVEVQWAELFTHHFNPGKRFRLDCDIVIATQIAQTDVFLHAKTKARERWAQADRMAMLIRGKKPNSKHYLIVLDETGNWKAPKQLRPAYAQQFVGLHDVVQCLHFEETNRIIAEALGK